MFTRHIVTAGLLVMVAAASSTAEPLNTLVSPNEEQSGSFGFSVSGAGDVDGDGYTDVVVGASREAPGDSPYDAGRAYVYSGRTGVLLHTLVSPNEGSGGGLFGTSVAGVGDVDGDGDDDVVIGAYRESPGGSPYMAGSAYLFSGQTGELLQTLISPQGSTRGYFGFSVSGAGDLSDDGWNDVVIGAWGTFFGGRAFTFNGQTGRVLDTLTSPNEEDDGWFGYSVSGTGDINGDGRPDIVVGAPREDPYASPYDAGRAYVFSGRTGALLYTLVSPNEEINGYFGHSVSGVGDVNGDGDPDIVAGAPYENPGHSPYDAGRAYVFNGANGELLHELTSPNETPGGQCGQAVAGVGDVNGDGYDDVMVGANRENPGSSPQWAGRAHIFSGRTGRLLYTLVSPNEEEWGYFGYSVAGAGDVNGDGHPDAVVGAHNEAPGGSPSWAGRSYVFSWMHLSSEVAGGDLVLQWSTWTPAVEYWIYGMANEPWFVPDQSPPTYVNRIAVLPSATTTWSSPSGIGDPDANWTYLVMAVDASDAELARSNRVGEEDFEADIP